jgi:SAM-dependent methyltransferase
VGTELPEGPVTVDWAALRECFREAVREHLAGWSTPSRLYGEEQLAFALGRLDAGVGLVRYVEAAATRRTSAVRDVLDVGAGNGGVALAFANCRRYRVSAVDVGPNRVLRRVARSTALRLDYCLADGQRLPYAPQSFDLVLLVETIEHVPSAGRLGREIMRILRPGGQCFVTTPARGRFLLRPDPHYAVRGIAGLPNPLQRFVVNRIARRRVIAADGRSWPAYDVEHLFWHVREVARLFPGLDGYEALYDSPPLGGPFLSRGWWRRTLRGFLFDHIVITKGA